MAHKLPRAKCPYCGRTQALTKDGKLRKHQVKDGVSAGRQCGGSGQRGA
jgi:hypothetical protein